MIAIMFVHVYMVIFICLFYLSVYLIIYLSIGLCVYSFKRVNMQLELRSHMSYANPCIAGLVILDDEDRVHCMATHKLYACCHVRYSIKVFGGLVVFVDW